MRVARACINFKIPFCLANPLGTYLWKLRGLQNLISKCVIFDIHHCACGIQKIGEQFAFPCANGSRRLVEDVSGCYPEKKMMDQILPTKQMLFWMGYLMQNVSDIVSDLSEPFATEAREDPQQCLKQSRLQKHVGHNGFFGDFDFCHISNALLQPHVWYLYFVSTDTCRSDPQRCPMSKSRQNQKQCLDFV